MVLGLCVKVEKGLDIWKDASHLFTLKEVSRKDLLENMKFLSAWVPTVQWPALARLRGVSHTPGDNGPVKISTRCQDPSEQQNELAKG